MRENELLREELDRIYAQKKDVLQPPTKQRANFPAVATTSKGPLMAKAPSVPSIAQPLPILKPATDEVATKRAVKTVPTLTPKKPRTKIGGPQPTQAISSSPPRPMISMEIDLQALRQDVDRLDAEIARYNAN
jgi:hypothetical protein